VTPKEKELVRASFESIGEYSDSVVKLFYGRLFEIAPQVRPLFRVDIGEQSRKLMNMLTTIIDALDNFEALQLQLEDLGRKHVGYGAKPEHYEALRVALLWAIGSALEAEFDKETKEAWNALLGQVAGAMIAGAEAVV
jgi:hemoglobin-like flavoprotein